jgi:hypothetical protein
LVVVAVQIYGRKIQIRRPQLMVRILNSLHVPLLAVAQEVAFPTLETRPVEMAALAVVVELTPVLVAVR